MSTVIDNVGEFKPEKPAAKGPRLPEIDIFRSLAILYMGITHGLIWLPPAGMPHWTDTVIYWGKYFCFPAFMLAFGMSLSIMFARGTIDKPGARKRLAIRALPILGAYYFVVLGRTLIDVVQHKAPVSILPPIIFLLKIPKAGEFFLSFFFCLLFVAAFPGFVKALYRRAWAFMAMAIVVHLIGFALSTHPVPDRFEAIWKLLFGLSSGPKSYPVLTYCPLFFTGLLLGKSYIASADKLAWARKCALVAASTVVAAYAVAALLGHVGSVARISFSPVPTLGYIVAGTAAVSLVFALCAIIILRAPTLASTPVSRFMVFVGQNSISTIVFQYITMVPLAHFVHHRHGAVGLLLFMAGMVLLPAALLAISKSIQDSMGSRAKD